jgi:NAD(P)-dependent dehydrogenase (short-subunit alcohol dehydrogenase family)
VPGTATYDYDGQSAIVTGSTKGIGRGIAEGLVEAGGDVAVIARTAADVEATVEELDALGDGEVIGVAADVGVPDDVERLVAESVEAFGTIDLLVNNAAVWREEPFVEASLEDWDETFDVNVRSQFYCSQLVARRMRATDTRGSIVNVTSQTGDRRAGRRGFYGVSKTAINGLTWRLAHEFAQYGIRVNAVSTDATDTYQLRLAAASIAEETGRTVEDVLAEMGEERPIGRLGRPEDLADAVLFLASDRASYVVGTVLRVSGGGNLQ